MTLQLGIVLELDEEQLKAMACVANRGPTNRTLPEKAVIEFWAAFLYSAIEGAKKQNIYYASLSQEGREEFEKIHKVNQGQK